jgi:hypothetical protein
MLRASVRTQLTVPPTAVAATEKVVCPPETAVPEESARVKVLAVVAVLAATLEIGITRVAVADPPRFTVCKPVDGVIVAVPALGPTVNVNV